MDNPEIYNSNNPLIENSLLGSKFLNPEYLFNQGGDFLQPIFTSNTSDVFYTIFTFLSMFFIAIIIYTIIRILEIRAKQREYLKHEIAKYAQAQALREQKEKEEGGIFRNPQWKKVLDFLFSTNKNDWKLAIIEADLMLFSLLVQMGFKGESLGDKLKSADRENFRSLSVAWEVHNIRNKIAHEGSAFPLSLNVLLFFHYI